MKRILLIFFLFHSLLNGQSLTGQQIGGKPALRTSGTLINISDNAGLNPSFPLGYVQRAVDFFKRVTDAGKTLTDAQKRWYNDSIFVQGITHGYIGTTRAGDSLVALYSFSLKWAGDSTVANMNLLADQYNCIHYGGVTYTDSGVVGNGSTGYLNTFFNPINDSSICKAYSMGLFVCIKGGAEENNKYYGGAVSTTTTAILRQTTQIIYTVNGDPWESSVSGAGIMQSVGIYRVSSTHIYSSQNGTAGTLVAKTGKGLINLPIYVLAGNGQPGNTQHCISFFAITSGLSATLSQYLSDDLNNALKGAGYNVY
jgi:hypothetical protein